MAGRVDLLGMPGMLLRYLRQNGDLRTSRKFCFVGFRVQTFGSRWTRSESCTPSARVYCSFQCAESTLDHPAGGKALRLIDSLSDKQVHQVDRFVELLLRINSEKFNLTAVTEKNEVMERHVEDSLALLPVIEAAYTDGEESTNMPKELRVVDVGSGGGLPGVILAIARPDWKFTLLDSVTKRCNFLRMVIDHSKLENVDVVCSRAEVAGKSKMYREKFDVAVARAVAEMRVLAELCLPLVRVNGFLVAAKGANPQDEVNDAREAVSTLGGRIRSLCTVQSMSPNGPRTAVVCYKERVTPEKYPRRAGTPKKDPL